MAFTRSGADGERQWSPKSIERNNWWQKNIISRDLSSQDKNARKIRRTFKKSKTPQPIINLLFFIRALLRILSSFVSIIIEGVTWCWRTHVAEKWWNIPDTKTNSNLGNWIGSQVDAYRRGGLQIWYFKIAPKFIVCEIGYDPVSFTAVYQNMFERK